MVVLFDGFVVVKIYCRKRGVLVSSFEFFFMVFYEKLNIVFFVMFLSSDGLVVEYSCLCFFEILEYILFLIVFFRFGFFIVVFVRVLKLFFLVSVFLMWCNFIGKLFYFLLDL